MCESLAEVYVQGTVQATMSATEDILGRLVISSIAARGAVAKTPACPQKRGGRNQPLQTILAATPHKRQTAGSRGEGKTPGKGGQARLSKRRRSQRATRANKRKGKMQRVGSDRSARLSEIKVEQGTFPWHVLPGQSVEIVEGKNPWSMWREQRCRVTVKETCHAAYNDVYLDQALHTEDLSCAILHREWTLHLNRYKAMVHHGGPCNKGPWRESNNFSCRRL